jgi:hypothetical protein
MTAGGGANSWPHTAERACWGLAAVRMIAEFAWAKIQLTVETRSVGFVSFGFKLVTGLVKGGASAGLPIFSKRTA